MNALTGAQSLSYDALHSEELRWRGVVEVKRTPTGMQPFRLPAGNLARFPDERLRSRARMPSGVRLAFASQARAVIGRIARADGPMSEVPLVDVVRDGHVHSLPVADDGSFGLCLGEEWVDSTVEWEIWLPQFGEIEVRMLEADAPVDTPGAPGPRLITYGSSLTQCRGAASPTRTWPAIVAREAGVDLLSLGFGGECHLDPSIARLIRDTPAAAIVCCIGINIAMQGTFSERTLEPAILGFLETVLEREDAARILVMSPVVSPVRETDPGPSGLSLVTVRRIVRAAVDALAAPPDRVRYLDGSTILRPEESGLLIDDVHPGAEGYELMAGRLAPEIASMLR